MIGKSIENVGRTVKVDPLPPVVTVRSWAVHLITLKIVSDRSPNDGLIGRDGAARAAQVDLLGCKR
jgi:hypothetical protein